eukprot:350381-Chlamydomonas_euryale.AAC.5
MALPVSLTHDSDNEFAWQPVLGASIRMLVKIAHPVARRAAHCASSCNAATRFPGLWAILLGYWASTLYTSSCLPVFAAVDWRSP